MISHTLSWCVRVLILVHIARFSLLQCSTWNWLKILLKPGGHIYQLAQNIETENRSHAW